MFGNGLTDGVQKKFASSVYIVDSEGGLKVGDYQFSKYDVNGDGVLSSQELVTLKKDNIEVEDSKMSAIKDIWDANMSEFDEDGDGQLTKDEYMKMFTK